MSVRIKRDKLTDDQIIKIRKYLCMQPKAVGFFKKKRFFQQAKDPILMYHVDKQSNEIVLPYTFGNMLLGQHINSQLSYPIREYNFTGQLRPYQVPVAEEATNHLNNKGTTILGLYPSFGKTILAAYLASVRKGLTLVVHPIKIVEPSWKNTFEQFTTARVWVNHGNILPTEQYDNYDVIITQDTQFHKLPYELLRQVKVLIVDEAHMFCVPNRVHCLLGTTPLFVIACTATLNRRDEMESIIHSVCGTEGIFKKNPKRFTVYRLATGIQTEIKLNKMGDPDWSQLVKDLSEDPLRNAMIFDMVERNIDHKIMILTWHKDHARFLKDTLEKRGTSVDILIGNKNTYRDSRVLVGTLSKIGTGFDEQMSAVDWSGKRSNLMILTGSTKSIQNLDQFTGRVFRADFPTIVDMVDDNRICKNHWKQREKFYEDPERNGTVLWIEMKKDEGFLGNKSDDKNSDGNMVKRHNSMVNRVKLKIQNK
jgi:superfamily II DNA or RNA helicase